MSGVVGRTRYVRADEARKALAARYRDLGDILLAAARALESASVVELAEAPTPVRHLHSGARAEEEALDAALTAL